MTGSNEWRQWPRQLLDFSRGEVRLHKVEISVDMFVIVLVQSVKMSMERSQIQLRVSNNCKRMVRFDTDRLLRPCESYHNSQDAMPTGGEIRVTIDEHDKMIRFVVADNGAGIRRRSKGGFSTRLVTAGKKKRNGLGWPSQNASSIRRGIDRREERPGKGRPYS